MIDGQDAAPSNGAGEETAIVETNVAETPAEQPIAKSSGEAIDRAFEQVSQEPKTVQNRKPDGKFAKGKTEVKDETVEYQAQSPEPTPNIAQAAYDVSKLSNFGLTKDALAVASAADPKLLADIERRFTELTQGIEKHKTGSESWAKGQKYVEMAQAAGKDVWSVMDQYVQMENALRNPQTRAQGLFALAQNMGLDPMTLAQEIAQAAQGQQYQPAQPQDNEPLEAKIERAIAQREALQTINTFKAEHPGYDQLQDRIGQILESKDERLPQGVTGVPLLKAAYELAANEIRSLVSQLTPAEAAAQATATATQTPAAQTTPQAVQTATPDPKTKAKANLSITGSPEGGSNPATRKIPGSTSEALDSAFARVGL